MISILVLIPCCRTSGDEADETRREISERQEIQAPSRNNSGPVAEQLSYRPWQCLMCPPGSPGPRGLPGPQGFPGRDGRDGRDQISAKPTTGCNTPTDQPPTTDGSSTGATYVHWGKSNCPGQSSLVYAGVVGGKHYTQKGSGTNYLCLHSNPTYDRPRVGRGPHGAYIYGTEFEAGSFPGLPELPKESEVACSVCLANSKREVLMIPGVNSCPGAQDWTEEYHGYLMANHHDYYATEFICVDHEAEGIPRTGHDNDPSLLYMAEGVCSGNGGGLPCPPYIDGHEVTCVVCSL